MVINPYDWTFLELLSFFASLASTGFAAGFYVKVFRTTTNMVTS